MKGKKDTLSILEGELNESKAECRDLKMIIKKKDVELEKHHAELKHAMCKKNDDMVDFQKAAREESARLSSDVANLLKRQIKFTYDKKAHTKEKEELNHTIREL